MKFFTTNLNKFDFVVSFLTKTEVGRELASGFDLQKNEIEKLWNSFTKTLKCQIVEKFEFDMKLADLAMEARMKLRTIVNFQHLFVAMNENAYFVTGDKNLLKIVKERKIYDKFLSYIELMEMIT